MSSIVFLISMGLVIYFLIQGDKQDKIDREETIKEASKKKGNNK
jgi:hypothetical protein